MALNARIRTAELQTNNMEYRLEWAKTAIEMDDLSSAAQALGGVDQKSRSSAEFHKLAGGLAWNLHYAAEAEKQYADALQLEPTNLVVILNLATVRLVFDQPGRGFPGSCHPRSHPIALAITSRCFARFGHRRRRTQILSSRH